MTRIRAVRVKLTDEQRARVRAATGEDVREAIIAARVNHDDFIEEEVAVQDDGYPLQILQSGTARFIDALERYPVIRAGYEKYTKHPIDADEPAIALLR